MSELTVTLVEALFGIGNINHPHVHRHNTLELNSTQLDNLKYAQLAGGVSPSMITEMGLTSGGISASPQGMVTIEEGWNLRRGIGLLRFLVDGGSIMSRELSVLVYCYGGMNSHEGIDGEVMCVPQRSWTVETRQHPDAQGLPVALRTIVESNQFLLGDPDKVKHMKSLRPLDLAQEVLGSMSMEEEGHTGQYYGDTSSNLDRNVVMSKTNNLDPTHHAIEMIKMAANGMHEASLGMANMGIANSLRNPSLNEIMPSHNEFILAMCQATGNINLAGFAGYSVSEIAQVFPTFNDVLDLRLMDENMFLDAENLLNSKAPGSIQMDEILAKELAALTVHLMVKEGLQHIRFSATNNPHHIGGISGSPDGFEFIPGEFGSVLREDDNAIGRVERFRQGLGMSFFAKYTSNPYTAHATLVNVDVAAHMFGETDVRVSVNDQPMVSFIDATYAISRTSTNIAARDVGAMEATQILENLRSHFDY